MLHLASILSFSWRYGRKHASERVCDTCLQICRIVPRLLYYRPKLVSPSPSLESACFVNNVRVFLLTAALPLLHSVWHDRPNAAWRRLSTSHESSVFHTTARRSVLAIVTSVTLRGDGSTKKGGTTVLWMLHLGSQR